jgi:hypothetical protein
LPSEKRAVLEPGVVLLFVTVQRLAER